MLTLAPNHHRPHPPLDLGRVDLGNSLSGRGRSQTPERRMFSFPLFFFLESATNGLGWSSEKTWDGWEKELICIIDVSFAVLVSLHHFLFPFSFGHRPLTGTGGGHGRPLAFLTLGFLLICHQYLYTSCLENRRERPNPARLGGCCCWTGSRSKEIPTG